MMRKEVTVELFDWSTSTMRPCVIDQQLATTQKAGHRTGFILWDASLALARLITSQVLLPMLLPPGFLSPDWRWQQRSVLELGTGLGLGSISALLAGARRVVATDGDQALLELTRANIQRNTHGAAARAAVVPFAWGDASHRGGGPAFLSGHDVLIAADVLYGEHVQEFFYALSRLLTIQMVAVVSIEQRQGDEISCDDVRKGMSQAAFEGEGGRNGERSAAARCHMMEVSNETRVDWGGLREKPGKRFSVFFVSPQILQ